MITVIFTSSSLGGALQSHLRVVIQRAVDGVLEFAITPAETIERAMAALINAEH